MPNVSVKATIVGSSVEFSDVNPTGNGVRVDAQHLSHLLVEPNPEAYRITIELQGGLQFQETAITFNTSSTSIPRNPENPSQCTVSDTNQLTSGQSPEPISFSMHTTGGSVGASSLPNREVEDPTIVNNPPPDGA
jgi:hypothetical protein